MKQMAREMLSHDIESTSMKLSEMANMSFGDYCKMMFLSPMSKQRKYKVRYSLRAFRFHKLFSNFPSLKHRRSHNVPSPMRY